MDEMKQCPFCGSASEFAVRIEDLHRCSRYECQLHHIACSRAEWNSRHDPNQDEIARIAASLEAGGPVECPVCGETVVLRKYRDVQIAECNDDSCLRVGHEDKHTAARLAAQCIVAMRVRGVKAVS